MSTNILTRINPGLSFRLPSLKQTLRTSRVITVQVVTLVALCSLNTVAASCEESERICIHYCLDGRDGREAGLCLVGCKLAYLACIFFKGS